MNKRLAENRAYSLERGDLAEAQQVKPASAKNPTMPLGRRFHYHPSLISHHVP